MDFYSLPPRNFLGLENQRLENSRVVVVPVPYDGTTTYRGGARYGPRAIIDASMNIELYDIELDCEPSKIGIFTLNEVEPDKSSVEKTLARVEYVVSEILEKDKFPVLLGGEHSLTIGVVRAILKKFPNLSVLQLDAHADMRDEYEGTKYNHACVMRRLREMCNIVQQVGIRSMSAEENAHIREKLMMGSLYFSDRFSEAAIDEITTRLGEDVYITIDLDVFDPSEMPSVGTPEPGGMKWSEVLSLLKKVGQRKNIVGFDVVELSPISGNIAPDFMAAKLVYKMIGYSFYHVLK
ncbi:MAG: agmatinase [Candidatus Micrarchaeia archaeon]